jgi:FkbM family methyltransferase
MDDDVRAQLAGISVYGGFPATRITLAVPQPVTLRLGTSDAEVFSQVFVERHYDAPYLPVAATRIVDLGANIGLASVFFAARYPAARIVAVEPDPENFKLAGENLAGLPVTLHRAAAWPEDGVVSLEYGMFEGESLGAWGVQVVAGAGGVRAVSMPTLLEQAGFDEVDYLKIDIEGAERELFGSGAERWLRRVRLFSVETHDRFRAGAQAAVRAAVERHDFEELPAFGESLWFRRR